ncbi:hypothetical protein TURU_112106 [Turdus rufiventris]|nr:hypothetical protein TURU_112106 [Turdus rufiventris]
MGCLGRKRVQGYSAAKARSNAKEEVGTGQQQTGSQQGREVPSMLQLVTADVIRQNQTCGKLEETEFHPEKETGDISL